MGFGDQTRERLYHRGHVADLNVRNVKSYVPVPFFMSTLGVGVLVNTTHRVVFDMQYRKELPLDEIELYIFPSTELSQFELYEDDGISLEHTNGSFATTRITAQTTKDAVEVTIAEPTGDLQQVPASRRWGFRIALDEAPAQVVIDGETAEYPDQLQLVGSCDLEPDRATQFCEAYGGRPFADLDDLLGCEEIDAVINLTIHTAHGEVTRRILEAGKHVHSEKPLAVSREEAVGVVELAKERGLLLGCSPFVILGEAQQTLWKAVRDGMVGDVLEVIAEQMHGRIESWHPNPAPFYGFGAGPLLDVGCYPLNVLTSIFGPVRAVRGTAASRIPERTIAKGPLAGQTFEVTAPDHVNGLLDFASGVGGRLSASFVVEMTTHKGVEVHGTEGSLFMSSPSSFDAELKSAPIGKKEWEPVPLVAEAQPGVEWARNMLDMADALHNDRPLRCTGAQAYHILDVCLSIMEAAEEGGTKVVETRFDAPAPTYE